MLFTIRLLFDVTEVTFGEILVNEIGKNGVS